MSQPPHDLVGSAVRARHMKSFVEAVDALGADVSSRIRAGVPGSLLAAVDEATPSAWLPLDMNVELTEVTSRALGVQRSEDFFRRMMLAEYETSLFKSFVATSLRMLGFSPATFVKMTPKGWPLVFRRCGEFRVLERAAREARLLFTRIPERCTRNELWLESVRSSFLSAFDVTRTPGTLHWEELSLPARRAVFLFRW